MLERAVAAHTALEQVALDEGGLDGLVGALGRADRRPRARCVDARGQLLAGRHPPGGRPRAGGARRVRRPAAGRAADAPLTELDRLVVHQAVTIVALELLRRRVAADTERRLAGDVLACVLSGELDGEELERRIAPVRPRRPHHGSLVAHEADAPARAARTRSTGSSRARHARLRAVSDGGDGDVRAGGGAPAPAPASPPAPAAPCPARRGPPRLPRGALGARVRGARTATTPPPVHLPRPRLLPAAARMQDDDALRTFCDSILGPLENARTPATPPSCCARSRSSSSATASGSAPPASCPATATPSATGSSASSSSPAARWTPRATASTSGSPCAGANSSTTKGPTACS